MKDITLQLTVSDEQFKMLLDLLALMNPVVIEQPATPLKLSEYVECALRRYDIRSEEDLRYWANCMRECGRSVFKALRKFRDIGNKSLSEIQKAYPDIF